MNKIEAAEALAAAVERHRISCNEGYDSSTTPFDTLQDAWKAVGAALSAYRSASVPSDELTDEEREYLVSMLTGKAGVYKVDSYDSILRKLGREPEPVWEWDSHNSMWTLGGKVDRQVFPCASVMLSSVGILARVYLSEMDATSVNVDSFAEACEWCEQKIREARQ